MKTILEKQFQFTKMVAELINFVYSQGYTLTFGDAYAKTGHSPNSFHYQRLAVDFNLFKDKELLRDTESHRQFGEFWKSIGGTWGGDFKSPDGNHYSLGEKT